MKLLQSSLVFAFLCALFLCFSGVTFAEDRLPSEWKQTPERVGEFQNPVNGDDSIDKVNQLFLKNFVPIARFLFIGVGILFLALYAYQMAIGKGEEDQLTTQRSNILFAALGFAVIGLAAEFVSVFNPIRESEDILDQEQLSSVVLQIVNYMEVLLGTIAIAVIFYGGIRLITANGDEERTTESKNILLYGFMGFVIVMLADPLISKVFYPALGASEVGQQQAVNFVQEGLGVLKFVLQFLGAIIFIAFIYAALSFLFAGVDEDSAERAKRILIWTVVGFIIIVIAYSIVMFFLPG